MVNHNVLENFMNIVFIFQDNVSPKCSQSWSEASYISAEDQPMLLIASSYGHLCFIRRLRLQSHLKVMTN